MIRQWICGAKHPKAFDGAAALQRMKPEMVNLSAYIQVLRPLDCTVEVSTATSHDILGIGLHVFQRNSPLSELSSPWTFIRKPRFSIPSEFRAVCPKISPATEHCSSNFYYCSWEILGHMARKYCFWVVWIYPATEHCLGLAYAICSLLFSLSMVRLRGDSTCNEESGKWVCRPEFKYLRVQNFSPAPPFDISDLSECRIRRWVQVGTKPSLKLWNATVPVIHIIDRFLEVSALKVSTK